MEYRPKVLTFDVDPDSLASLREAFPAWEIEAAHGVSAAALPRDETPGVADLLVVGARDQVAETLGLCRGLRGQAGREQTPLLVLVPPAQEALVRTALAAGASSCLVLPVHAQDLVRMAARTREGNQPGRHTLDLQRA